MRKTALIFITGLVFILCNNRVKACDYMVWISTCEHPNGMGNIDTLTIDEGQTIPLYGIYMNGMISYFQDPIRQLVWTRNGVPFDTTNAQDAIYDNTLYYHSLMNISLPGEYEVVYYTPGGVPMIFGKVVVLASGNSVSGTASIENQNKSTEFHLYPNPVMANNFYIENKGLDEITSIEMINTSGNMVLEMVPTSNGIISIQTNGFEKGLYFVRMNYRGSSITKKLIIN